MQIDVHQHLWTEPLLDALAARDELPFIRRTHGVTVLHAAGEQPYVIDVQGEAPQRRAALVDADGLDLAIVSLSSAIGVESLAREDALTLIDAHLEGVMALPDRFAGWSPVALDKLDPDDVDMALARGSVGISIPAGALAGLDALARVGPLLERIAEHRVALFVHPGPAPGAPPCEVALTEPLWWRALTDYVAQMQAAWLTFATLGRRAHPDLRVVFAMLAGGAPLLWERIGSRGGPEVQLADPLVFYDTSSYGPVAIEMTAARVGSQQLLYGSDRPVVEPARNEILRLLATNGARLLLRSAERASGSVGLQVAG
jgi:predicted TIM-barrel fold metal-dependent hydrolase